MWPAIAVNATVPQNEVIAAVHPDMITDTGVILLRSEHWCLPQQQYKDPGINSFLCRPGGEEEGKWLMGCEKLTLATVTDGDLEASPVSNVSIGSSVRWQIRAPHRPAGTGDPLPIGGITNSNEENLLLPGSHSGKDELPASLRSPCT
jgi:hypothetical protein